MTLGALITGFVGDKYGRRFTYQINLLIFGLASLAAAFAQDMNQLIVCRFVQGLGLGAEIVVGYSTLTEFVPPKTRGRWLSFMAFLVVAGFPVTALLGYLIIPAWGWRPMFVIAGVGSLIVWYLRKNLPESPRWLESQGRTEEAEALMQAIEKEAAGGRPLPPVVVPAPVAAGQRIRHAEAAAAAAHDRRLLGADHDQHADLRLRDLPAAVLPAPGADHHQFARPTRWCCRSPRWSAARSAPILSDAIGRRWSIIGASVVTIVAGYIYARFNAASDPAIVLSVGFVLIVAIYVQTAILFGVYTPELFPTEIRLRANGICNTLGRGATVVSPFIVGSLMANLQAAGRDLADDRPRGRADRGGVGLGRRAAQPRAGGGRDRQGVIGWRASIVRSRTMRSRRQCTIAHRPGLVAGQ